MRCKCVCQRCGCAAVHASQRQHPDASPQSRYWTSGQEAQTLSLLHASRPVAMPPRLALPHGSSAPRPFRQSSAASAARKRPAISEICKTGRRYTSLVRTPHRARLLQEFAGHQRSNPFTMTVCPHAGTAHVSKASADEVRRLIRLVQVQLLFDALLLSCCGHACIVDLTIALFWVPPQNATVGASQPDTVLVELDEGRATRLQNGQSASLFEFLKVRFCLLCVVQRAAHVCMQALPCLQRGHLQTCTRTG